MSGGLLDSCDILRSFGKNYSSSTAENQKNTPGAPTRNGVIAVTLGLCTKDGVLVDVFGNFRLVSLIPKLMMTATATAETLPRAGSSWSSLPLLAGGGGGGGAGTDRGPLVANPVRQFARCRPQQHRHHHQCLCHLVLQPGVSLLRWVGWTWYKSKRMNALLQTYSWHL